MALIFVSDNEFVFEPPYRIGGEGSKSLRLFIGDSVIDSPSKHSAEQLFNRHKFYKINFFFLLAHNSDKDNLVVHL